MKKAQSMGAGTMKKYILIIIVLLILPAGGRVLPACAQTASRSGYFLEGYSFRHELNPAFEGEYNYISVPLIGNINQSLMGNVGLNNFIYPTDNGNTTFLSPTVDSDTFLGKLKSNSKLNEDLSITILSAGFKAFGGYNTVSLTSRTAASLNLPKDLLQFMKVGQSGSSTTYNFSGVNASMYEIIDLSLGHSREIIEGLRVGAKLNVLLGVANAEAIINNMSVTMSEDVWKVNADGELYIAAGSGLEVGTKDGDLVDFDNINYNSFGLAGFGLGLDLGATYQVLPELEVSAAVKDLAFMSWNNVFCGATSKVDWSFDGFDNVAVDGDAADYEENKISAQWEELKSDIEDCVSFHKSSKSSRTTGIGATVMLGAAYTMPFYDKLKAGALITQRVNGEYSWTECRLSANVSPVKWFEASVNVAAGTYSNSFGWMLNFHPKGFNFFIGSDHMIWKVSPQFLPTAKANMALNLGFNVTY